MKLVVLILITAGIVSAQQKKTEPKTEPKTEDTWQRSRQCTAQADKRFGNGDIGQSVMNHYSPKYKHCYVQILGGRNGVLTDELWDPFEFRLIAQHTSFVRDYSLDDPLTVDDQCEGPGSNVFLAKEIMKDVPKEETESQFGLRLSRIKWRNCLNVDSYIKDHMEN